MKKSLLVLITLLACVQRASACSGFMWQWSADDWVTKPDAIYYGQVVSISAPADYVLDGETDPLTAVVMTRAVSATIKLKVFETLRGPEQKVVEVTLEPCIGGGAGYLDEIVLFRVDDVWHSKVVFGDPSDKIAEKVVESLSKQHKP